jgi:intracellular sulfur oxidation DsrE/DsrF family protein
MRRNSFILAGLIALSALVTGCATTPPARDRVVFQVSDDDSKKWNLALNNAKNVQDSFGAANVDIEIVVYGPGIGMLKAEAPIANSVSAAVKSGVNIVACENTMVGAKLTKADMNADIGYVPAGVVELMTRQKQGWSYIRP